MFDQNRSFTTENFMTQDMFHSISSVELSLEQLRQQMQTQTEEPADILGFPHVINSPENLDLDLTPVISENETEEE